MWISWLLGFFTLAPIPPLDGSHVFKYLLPLEAATKYRQLYGLGYAPIIAFLVFVRLVPAAPGVYLWPLPPLIHRPPPPPGPLPPPPTPFSPLPPPPPP